MKSKSFALVISFLQVCVFSYSQQWGGSGNMTGFVTRDGDVRLHDNQSWRVSLGPAWGDVNIGYGTGYLGFNLSRNNHSDGYWTYFSDGANNGGQVLYGNIFGDFLFSNRITSGNSTGTMTDADIVNNIKMRINGDGKVIIGDAGTGTITSPGTYRLYVQTGILTEKVKVAVRTSADWADYVFDKGYKLMPLNHLEAYIQENKHLPGIPSAKEVIQNGQDLGAMNAKLLEKVEELSLYLIQINKQIEELKIENEKQKEEISLLKKK